MRGSDFRALLPERLRAELPPEWHHFEHRSRFSLFQLWYGEPTFHFEVAPLRRLALMEVGLHLEHRSAPRNAALHRLFDAHFTEIRHELGDCWLERWDRGWHKLYATLPFEQYDEPLLAAVTAQLARQIVWLQPLLEEGLAQSPRP